MVSPVSNIKLHCIGVGGEGVGSLGMLLAHLGVDVTGSDLDLSQAQKDNLSRTRIKRVFDHHSPEHVSGRSAVVYGSAIPRNNCELLEAYKLGLDLLPRAQLLGYISRSFKTRVAIVGTHGKTSTTTLFTQLVEEHLGVSAHSLLGGQCPQFEFSSYKPGKGFGYEWLIAEVTETDRDFGGFQADLVLCPSLSWDHFDKYPTPQEYQDEFLRFFLEQPGTSLMVLYTESRETRLGLKSLPRSVICIGKDGDCDYIFESTGLYSFNLYKGKISPGSLIIASNRDSLPGVHYSKNLAVAIVGLIEKFNWRPSNERLSFAPWKIHRRFSIETVAQREVIIDNAHHWEAISANLETIKGLFYERAVAIFFRPAHHFMPDVYASSLAGYDHIYLVGERPGSASYTWCEAIGRELERMKKEYEILPEEEIIKYCKDPEADAVIFICGAREQSVLRALFNYGDPAG